MQVVATPRLVTVAATQLSCTWTIEDNLVRQQHLQMLSVPASAFAAVPLLPTTRCRSHPPPALPTRRPRRSGWFAPLLPMVPTSSYCR